MANGSNVIVKRKAEESERENGNESGKREREREIGRYKSADF